MDLSMHSIYPMSGLNSYLAIDQGPEIIMIENYSTGLFGIYS